MYSNNYVRTHYFFIAYSCSIKMQAFFSNFFFYANGQETYWINNIILLQKQHLLYRYIWFDQFHSILYLLKLICWTFWDHVRNIEFILLTSIFYHFIDIDECASTPCDKNATCANTDGSFICTCNTGYSGDGFACEGKIIW